MLTTSLAVMFFSLVLHKVRYRTWIGGVATGLSIFGFLTAHDQLGVSYNTLWFVSGGIFPVAMAFGQMLANRSRREHLARMERYRAEYENGFE